MMGDLYRECRECGMPLTIPTERPCRCDSCCVSDRYEKQMEAKDAEIASLRTELAEARDMLARAAEVRNEEIRRSSYLASETVRLEAERDAAIAALPSEADLRTLRDALPLRGMSDYVRQDALRIVSRMEDAIRAHAARATKGGE